MLVIFKFIVASAMDGMRDIICSNDWHSLFRSSSGPEPCENHYEVGNQDEGPLFGPKTSRSHLLIKLREVTPGEKLASRSEMSMKTRLFSHFATNQKYSHCEVRQATWGAQFSLRPLQNFLPRHSPSILMEKGKGKITLMNKFCAAPLQKERALWPTDEKKKISLFIHSCIDSPEIFVELCREFSESRAFFSYELHLA